MSIEHIVLSYTLVGDADGALQADTRSPGGPGSDAGSGGRGDKRAAADVRLVRERSADDTAECALRAGGLLRRQRGLSARPHG